MHALVYRAWKNRVKGRDWYDFEWYVRHNVPLGFAHLTERGCNSTMKFSTRIRLFIA